MLNLYKDIDFYTKCETETTLFDRNFAEGDENWNVLKALYTKNGNSITTQSIPKIMHFIWLGGDLPIQYQYIISRWKEKTNFDVLLWNDITSEKFMQNKTLYRMFKESKNFGIRSDCLRYEILKHFGGVYIDTDFICLDENFGALHDHTQFYGGLLLEKLTQVGNGIIGTIPNHPIINSCIDLADDKRYTSEISCESTRTLFQTGPWVLTMSILNYIKNNNFNDILIFPSQSFHPFPAAYREHNDSMELVSQFIKPWSMACHLWHCSWQSTSKFFKGYALTNE